METLRLIQCLLVSFCVKSPSITLVWIFHCQSAGQQLSANDLLVVMEELSDVRAKWYDLGLQLHISIGTLDAIKEDCHSTSDCLRETLKTWLKTCPSPPTWSNIVDALRSNTVGEVRLAADLEHKYCSTQHTATHQHPLGNALPEEVGSASN